jgi:late competence protein required for DNA uptake (superfamily II DNA/RNA helicase)
LYFAVPETLRFTKEYCLYYRFPLHIPRFCTMLPVSNKLSKRDILSGIEQQIESERVNRLSASLDYCKLG